MTKKILFGMMAATMMIATSCENELDLGTNARENAQVTFSVGTPEIATRAYSDGQTATVLQYAVYDAAGNELTDLTVTDAEIHGSTTVNLQLTTGNTYSVIFWAAAENAPYTVDFGAKTMTVDYSNAVSNEETRDAFYKYHTFTVTGTQTETIELKRPFAQLNIGTSDYAATTSAGYTPAYSYVKVPVSKVLNLVDGSVDTAADVEFKLAAIPQGETFPVSGYDYLSMNYLLVPADKEVVDLTFGYSESNTAVEKTRTVGSVPVQRNYRTNIYGQLFTSDVDINVEIVPDYDDEYNNEHGFIVAEGKVLVSSAEGLQILAERMANGELIDGNIVLDGDIDLSELAVATRSSAVYNWTPMGTPEKPFTGTFDGQGHTIKNLNIVETEAKEGKAYIGFFGYAKNATIKNVTFENVYINIPCLDIDHSQGHIGAVAGSLEGTSTIENVTVKGDIKVYATQNANGASRVAVIAGGNTYGDVTMKNVHVIANEGSSLIANNNTGALAGQLQGKSVCENCTSNIDVTVNKFFAGGLIGLAAGDQLFVNCHTTGDVAVVAGREGKAHDQYRVGGIAGGWADGKTKVCELINCSYTGTLTGKNSDGSVTEVFDYLGYVGRGYTLNGCQGSKVVIDGISFVQKYNTAAEAGIYEVTGANGEAVVAAGSKEDLPKTDDGTKIDTNFDENVTLFGDITVSASETNANSGYGATGVTVTDGAVLDGQGNVLTVSDANGTWDCVVAAKGGTIKNLTVAGAMRGIFMPGANGDVYIDNVIFKDVIYTFNSDAGNKNYGVYISNSTLNGWTSHSDAHKEVVYTNCNFGEGSGYAYCRPYGPTSFVGCAFEAGFEIDARGKITFENCTLGGVALTAENLATLVTSRVENASIK